MVDAPSPKVLAAQLTNLAALVEKLDEKIDKRLASRDQRFETIEDDLTSIKQDLARIGCIPAQADDFGRYRCIDFFP